MALWDRTYGVKMNEASLIEYWNELRKSIIRSQMVSVVILSVVLVLAVIGQFVEASTEIKLFAVVVLFTTGALSLINQFAVLREGAAVVKDLSGSESATAKTIAGSASFLKLTQLVMAVSALAILVLFVVAIF
jgi:hypothetical protein